MLVDQPRRCSSMATTTAQVYGLRHTASLNRCFFRTWTLRTTRSTFPRQSMSICCTLSWGTDQSYRRLMGFYLVCFAYLLRPMFEGGFNSLLKKIMKVLMELFSGLLFMPIVRTIVKYCQGVTQQPDLPDGRTKRSNSMPKPNKHSIGYSGFLCSAWTFQSVADGAVCGSILVYPNRTGKDNSQ